MTGIENLFWVFFSDENTLQIIKKKLFKVKKKKRDQLTSGSLHPLVYVQKSRKNDKINKIRPVRSSWWSMKPRGGWNKTVSESTEEWPKGEYLFKAAKDPNIKRYNT